MRHLTRGVIVALVAVVLAACAEPAPKKPAPPVKAATARTGVVGLITEVKEQGVTQENWKDSLRYLFSNERDKNVISVRYEITVLYDDGTNGVVKVDEKPSFQLGQRVRVTGDQIEAVRR